MSFGGTSEVVRDVDDRMLQNNIVGDKGGPFLLHSSMEGPLEVLQVAESQWTEPQLLHQTRSGRGAQRRIAMSFFGEAVFLA